MCWNGKRLTEWTDSVMALSIYRELRGKQFRCVLNVHGYILCAILLNFAARRIYLNVSEIAI